MRWSGELLGDLSLQRTGDAHLTSQCVLYEREVAPAIFKAIFDLARCLMCRVLWAGWSGGFCAERGYDFFLVALGFSVFA